MRPRTEPIHHELDHAHIPAMPSDTTDGHDDMAEDTTTARRGDGDGASSPRRHGGRWIKAARRIRPRRRSGIYNCLPMIYCPVP